MRLGITLGGGFSPGPSKIFFNNSSLVAISSRSRQNSGNSARATIADINLMRLALRLCPAVARRIITILVVSYLLQGKSHCL